jgi:hypothetical protein
MRERELEFTPSLMRERELEFTSPADAGVGVIVSCDDV